MPQAGFRRLIDRFSRLMNNHDVDRLVELFTDDCVHHDPISSQYGKNGVRRFFASLFTAFPDLTLTVKNPVGNSELFAYEWRYSGTQNGPLPSPLKIPPTGRKVKLAGAAFAFLREGKIANLELYTDYGVMLSQLGIRPRAFEIPVRTRVERNAS